MDSTTVAPALSTGNGRTTPLSAVTLGWLGTSIDKLAELRAAKRQLDSDERTLTASVLTAMRAAGLPALRGEHAIATVGERHDLTPDPALFVEAVGLTLAAPALRVSVEKARGVLGDETLRAISETTTTTTLRVDPIRA